MKLRLDRGDDPAGLGASSALVVAGLLAALSLMVAGCGSSRSATETPSSGATYAKGSPEAAALAAAVGYLQEPPPEWSTDTDPPLSHFVGRPGTVTDVAVRLSNGDVLWDVWVAPGGSVNPHTPEPASAAEAPDVGRPPETAREEAAVVSAGLLLHQPGATAREESIADRYPGMGEAEGQIVAYRVDFLSADGTTVASVLVDTVGGYRTWHLGPAPRLPSTPGSE